MNQYLKKVITLGATAMLLGQSCLVPMQVLANELDTEQSLIQEQVETIETVEEESVSEPIEVETPLTQEETAEMFSLFEGMSRVSYGYTDENGNKVTVQEQSNEFSRATLDSSEYTPYTFHTSLNGYWAEGQMPVLKMDGEVVFCIEPAVTAHAGSGYNPMELPPSVNVKMSHIGIHGYNRMRTHESYVGSQGYIWELMGASFTTSYTGYSAMKNQIDKNIDNYFVRPSFDGQKVTVKMGEPVTLTDTNNVLSEYVKDVSTGGVKTSINGNKLTLTVDENTDDDAVVRMLKLLEQGTSIAYIKEGSQTVAKFENSDPVPFILNVEAIKLGNAEFQKISEISNLPMTGVTYRVQEQGKEPYEMKTDANGLLVFNDRIHGTTIDVTEIDNPLGYVLDTSTYRLVINGGKTVSQKLTNQIQRGRFSGVKYAEIFDENETWEIGEPVYEDVPVEGREFDVVAMNDILLPDGQTVVVQAGTVVDHVRTDAEGKFASNVDLYIGEQNKYKLVETNVPDDYRQPSDIQTEFSIPYGENTEALLFYDTGIIDNKLKKGDVIFNKKNSLLPDLGWNLEGATFLVQGLSPQVKHVQFTFTTEMTPTQLNLLAGYGTADYLFTEVEFPNGIGQSNGTPQTQIVRVVDGETTVVDWENTPLTPEIRSLFTTADGEKVIDPTVDNVLVDEVQGSGFLKDTPILVDSEFVVVDENNRFVRSLGHIEEVYEFESSSISFSVEHPLEKDTMTHGEKLVATHTFYNEEKTVEYAKEYDLTNPKQTISTEKEKEPKKETSKTSTPISKSSRLPVTGESPMLILFMLGVLLLAIVGKIVCLRKANK